MSKMNHPESNGALTLFYDLGRIVTNFRRRKGFSQKELADKCDITAPYLSQVEKGHKMPSHALFAKICEQLGVSQNDVFRLMFIDSFLETTDESKKEVIALLRGLLDKLILDDTKVKNLSNMTDKQPVNDMV